MSKERGSSMLRVLQLLEAIASAEHPLTVTELTAPLNLPKATAHRLCAMLEEEGFLQKRLDGRHIMPGERLHRLATGVLANTSFRVRRHTILQQLSSEIGETCNIAIPDGAAMVYFDRVETHWPLRLDLPIGTRVPLYCTAAGKLYLSSLPLQRRRRLIDGLDLTPKTANTITDREHLHNVLNDIRRLEIGQDNEEFIDGMVAIAVPIKDGNGRLYATVSFHAPVLRMGMSDALAYVNRLRQAASELAVLLDEQATD